MTNQPEFKPYIVDELKLSDDDVVSRGGNMIKYGTWMDWILGWIRNSGGGWPKPDQIWFTEKALSFEYLRADGGGWKKAKIRFRLEIISDESVADLKDESDFSSITNSPINVRKRHHTPNLRSDSATPDNPPVSTPPEPLSPLDDLRAKLNLDN